MTIQSYQTREKGYFYYNPLAGADIMLFPRDREKPRVYVLQAIHPFSRDYDKVLGGKQASACNGKVFVHLSDARQYTVMVGHKRTERYSIVYPSKKKKQLFSYY